MTDDEIREAAERAGRKADAAALITTVRILRSLDVARLLCRSLLWRLSW
jgi:hypothetical protein